MITPIKKKNINSLEKFVYKKNVHQNLASVFPLQKKKNVLKIQNEASSSPQKLPQAVFYKKSDYYRQSSEKQDDLREFVANALDNVVGHALNFIDGLKGGEAAFNPLPLIKNLESKTDRLVFALDGAASIAGGLGIAGVNYEFASAKVGYESARGIDASVQRQLDGSYDVAVSYMRGGGGMGDFNVAESQFKAEAIYTARRGERLIFNFPDAASAAEGLSYLRTEAAKAAIGYKDFSSVMDNSRLAPYFSALQEFDINSDMRRHEIRHKGMIGLPIALNEQNLAYRTGDTKQSSKTLNFERGLPVSVTVIESDSFSHTATLGVRNRIGNDTTLFAFGQKIANNDEISGYVVRLERTIDIPADVRSFIDRMISRGVSIEDALERVQWNEYSGETHKASLHVERLYNDMLSGKDGLETAARVVGNLGGINAGRSDLSRSGFTIAVDQPSQHDMQLLRRVFSQFPTPDGHGIETDYITDGELQGRAGVVLSKIAQGDRQMMDFLHDQKTFVTVMEDRLDRSGVNLSAELSAAASLPTPLPFVTIELEGKVKGNVTSGVDRSENLVEINVVTGGKVNDPLASQVGSFFPSISGSHGFFPSNPRRIKLP